MYNTEMGFINHELGKHGSVWDPQEADLSLAPREIADMISNADLSSSHGKLNAYLQVPITWSKTNDLYSILSSKGVQTGETPVSTVEVVSTFEEHFGVKNGIFPVCIAKKDNKHYFSEIRFCLDANYQITPCDENVVQSHIRNCSEYLIYPEFPNLESNFKNRKFQIRDY